jgi:hypothetical protein
MMRMKNTLVQGVSAGFRGCHKHNKSWELKEIGGGYTSEYCPECEEESLATWKDLFGVTPYGSNKL